MSSSISRCYPIRLECLIEKISEILIGAVKTYPQSFQLHHVEMMRLFDSANKRAVDTFSVDIAMNRLDEV
jgi:hypothetical protein